MRLLCALTVKPPFQQTYE